MTSKQTDMNGTEIRRIRKEILGMSQAALAMALGVSDARIVRGYEAGDWSAGGPVSMLMTLFEKSPRLAQKAAKIRQARLNNEG